MPIQLSIGMTMHHEIWRNLSVFVAVLILKFILKMHTHTPEIIHKVWYHYATWEKLRSQYEYFSKLLAYVNEKRNNVEKHTTSTARTAVPIFSVLVSWSAGSTLEHSARHYAALSKHLITTFFTTSAIGVRIAAVTLCDASAPSTIASPRFSAFTRLFFYVEARVGLAMRLINKYEIFHLCVAQAIPPERSCAPKWTAS